jgi:murein L,D-transpeptidase YafK
MRKKHILVIGPPVVLAAVFAWANWPLPAALPSGARADRVVVSKARRTLELFHGGQLLRSYTVALGRNPVGPKQREGDARTPEGRYILDYRNPTSAFHLSLHVSYPSSADRSRASAAGVNPGGLIMVHGLRNGLGLIGRLHRFIDWTNGCIAVTNPEIEELARVVPDGTPILIQP